MITVFTPTYNRAYILKELYASLQKQTNFDFEWICIDDGSTDETATLIEKWQKEDNEFPIYYEKVVNGGKHRAINRGVRLAKGEAFFIVDSDDHLTNDAIEKVKRWFAGIVSVEDIAGVSGLRGYNEKEPNGGYGSFEDPYVDASNLEREKYGLLGDKAEIYKTDVLRRYPFPEIDGENFVTEPVVWNQIALDGYKIRWYNEIIYLGNYLEDGLTMNSTRKFIENPKGTLYYLSVLEKCHGKDEVDILRLKYYNEIIDFYGWEKAAEVIRLGQIPVEQW